MTCAPFPSTTSVSSPAAMSAEAFDASCSTVMLCEDSSARDIESNEPLQVMFVSLFAGGVEAWRVIKAFPFLQRQLTLISDSRVWRSPDQESRVNCASEDIESSNTGWSDNENWIRMAVLYSDATEFLAYGFDHVYFPTSRRAVDVGKLLLHLFIGQYPG
jgi:hypothetical protein